MTTRVWIVVDAATKDITRVCSSDPSSEMDDGEFMSSRIHVWDVDGEEVDG